MAIIGPGIVIGPGITFSPPTPNMRNLLSASGQAAYDAAATDSFFSVSVTDYNSVASGLANVSKYVMSDSIIAENGNLWAANTAQAYPSTISTVPTGAYLFGFMCRTAAAGTATPLISTTFKGTYTAIANTVNTVGSANRSYFLRKASGATAATSYLGLVQNTNGYLSTTQFNPSVELQGGYDTTSPYSTWSAWTAGFLIYQVLGSNSVQW